MPDTRLAIALGVVGFVCGLLYAFTTPLWQAPDEPSHFGYIEYIDSGRGLPSPLEAKVPVAAQAKARAVMKWPRVSEPLPDSPRVLPAEEFAYRDLMYTANHPPLYYLAARPFAKVGAVVGETRLSGLAYGARVFSAILIGLTVSLAFFSARLVRLSRANALLVASLVLLQPQYLFIGSSINNDGLTIFLWSAFVYLMLLEIRQPSYGRQLLIGATLGLGLLTKITFFLALPLTVAGFLLAHPGDRNQALRRAGAAVLLAFFISGWWFIGNIFRYGSPWYIIGGTGLGPATFAEFFTASKFYHWLFKSYWGYFGWMEKQLPRSLYAVMLVMSVFAALGAALSAIKTKDAVFRRSLGFLALSALTLFAGAIWFRIVAQTGQGRYLFPSIIPFTILLWIGLRSLTPDRLKSWLAHGTLLLFAGLSAAGLALIRQL